MLKKSNYEVKNLGITLPTAYAAVRSFNRTGNQCVAEFYIHNSRENALNKDALERRTVSFSLKNEMANPFDAAEREAIKKRVRAKPTNEYEIKVVDGIEHRTLKFVDEEYPAVLDGWEHDVDEVVGNA